ncbi:MAG: hypothetical protein LBK82_00495 [Planctomycetaceae bacterium]|nr:hypothetical protein [Planctomycetaceae bacterium]
MTIPVGNTYSVESEKIIFGNRRKSAEARKSFSATAESLRKSENRFRQPPEVSGRKKIIFGSCRKGCGNTKKRCNRSRKVKNRSDNIIRSRFIPKSVGL